MRHLSKDKVELRSYVDGYYDENGEWVEGSFKKRPLYCCIQPDYKGSTRLIEELGVRSEDCLTFHCRDKLLTVDEDINRQADRVVYEGWVWEIQKSKPWTTLRRLTHFECVAIRKDKDADNGGT